MAYNQAIISTLSELATFKAKDGNHFKARAYDREKEKFMLLTKPINSVDDLKGIKIGASTKKVILELLNTGKVGDLEKSRGNPKYDFADVYGIGPKKAKDLVQAGIKNIDDLRKQQDELLNDTQKIGLLYYEDILLRIPREEIKAFLNVLFRLNLKPVLI